MARLTDPAEIRGLLNADRVWGVFALGDLLPEGFAKSQWFGPDLTLVYSDYGTCILFAMGEGSLAEGLAQVSWPVHLQVRSTALAALERLAVVTKRTAMWRMGWNGDRSGWVAADGARRLTAADVPALERLYAKELCTGSRRTFSFRRWLGGECFSGFLRDRNSWPRPGHTCMHRGRGWAMGNIYTRRDRRGRGLGKLVTCATLSELAHLQTVGLSVRVDNAPAIRMYEAVGFRKHCEFFEGLATQLR